MSRHEEDLLALLRERNELLKEQNKIMATLDLDVQTATTVINDLVTALSAAGSGVDAADQAALETAIAAGQAALTPAAPVSSPEVSTSA
jgi:hypothetical protein